MNKENAEKLRIKEAEWAEEKRRNEPLAILFINVLETIVPNAIDYFSNPKTSQDNPKEE